MNKLVITLAIATPLIFGCATSPEELPTTYISPLKYKKYDCDQLIEEMDHISHRVSTLHTSLDKKADNDSAQMGVGLILLWPTLFFLEGGDGPEATEYSNLKGEYEAIRIASVRKKCSSEYMPPSPDEIIKQKSKQDTNAINEEEDF